MFGASVPCLLLEREQPSAGANAPVSAKEATARIKLPEGFTVSQFAAEPDVVQPIAMTIDHKGRLWVVENYAYPIWLGGPHGKDRILIFEDADGDGRFDRRTVFFDKGPTSPGIELGFGGVWVCSTPNLLFIPDRDGDDRPDGPPVVKLDGWSQDAKHNMFNGLKWGPDGWLWGCNGILSISRVGKPGTPDDRSGRRSTAASGGIIRRGRSSRPWLTARPTLGARLRRLRRGVHHELRDPASVSRHPRRAFRAHVRRGHDPNRYDLMETCADHIHWAGGRWQDSRRARAQHGEPGGGHAHVGAMIYLGDNWPDRYRNGVFTCNLHGRRVNHDRLERRSPGYVARHEKDFLRSTTPGSAGSSSSTAPTGPSI